MTPEQIAMMLSELEQRSKGNAHRLDKVEERQDNLDKLVSSVSAMANEQEHIKEDVTEIKSDVKSLAEKPGKRWDGLVEKVILTAVAIIFGFIFARMGING